MKDKLIHWIIFCLLLLASMEARLPKIRKVSLFTAGRLFGFPARPLKATFCLLYYSLGLRCWGEGPPLEGKGQVYVQIGEGD